MKTFEITSHVSIAGTSCVDIKAESIEDITMEQITDEVLKTLKIDNFEIGGSTLDIAESYCGYGDEQKTWSGEYTYIEVVVLKQLRSRVQELQLLVNKLRLSTTNKGR